MAQASWNLGQSDVSIDKVNKDISNITLIDSEDTSKGTQKKTKRRETRRLVQSATTSPSSNPSTPSHSSPGLFRQNSADNSLSSSKKFSGTKSKIPLRQRLSASDSLCETTRRYNYLHNGGHYPGVGKSSSSSSSQSSEATKIRRVKDKFRRSSDSFPEKGHLVPYGLRIQHAAHRCAWSESDNNSTSLGSVGPSQNTPTMSKRIRSIQSSAGTLSPSTPRGSACRQHGNLGGRSFSQQSKFDVYLPLCEVQQGLKKGEVLEGVLRINPRNYEDAYISAPDGQMDIYIGGMRDRNRALNGDLVAVQLGPIEEWRIMFESIKEYEERNGYSIFEELQPVPTASAPVNVGVQPIDIRNSASSSVATGEAECSGWNEDCGPRMPDTVEILGVATLQQQIDSFCKQVKKERKNRRNRRNKNKKDISISPELKATKTSEVEISEISSSHSATNHASSSIDVTDASLLVNDSLAASTVKLANLSVTSNSTHLLDYNPVTSGKLEELSLSNDIPAPREPPIVIDTWTLEKDARNGPRWVVSPEDLLNLDDFEIPQFKADKTNAEDSESDDDSSKAVPPDELSEEENSPSVGGDSNSSHYAEQALEDAAFFASQQDAYNNNSGEDNVVDAYLTLNNEEPVPSAEAAPSSGEVNAATLVPSDPTSISAALVEAVNYSSSSEDDPVTGLEEKLANVHKVVAPTVNTLSWPQPAPPENNSARSNLPDKCQWEAAAATGCSVEEVVVNVNDLNPSSGHVSPLLADNDESEMQDGKKKKKRSRKRKKKSVKVATDANPDVHINSEAPRFNKTVRCDKPCVVKSEIVVVQPIVRSQNNVQHRSFTIYDILALPTCGKFVQKTGKVVYIMEKVNSRVAMGHLKLLQDRNPNWALFSPSDHRLPRIMVPMEDCPEGFFARPSDFSTTLFIARITDWEDDANFARGRLVQSLGKAGEIEPETEGILIENDVDCSEFDQVVLDDLPKNLPWTIPASEISERRDFRRECVFTIDPKTARDLDDAISCKVLPQNVLEIGVHIADVSYFVKEGTFLDKVATRRATSVYLVQKVVPMLPRLLCEELCSLNPGQDRLTFSVVWKMTPDGVILDEWFGRTVIRSCVKLSYEHAQDMIENPNKEWKTDELPPIDGGFTKQQIVDIVQKLQRIAINLRRKRFQDGALRLDQVKLQFTLNHETGLPTGYSIHELKDSNRLIEELMLLANMAVAHKIYKTYPEKAFLRSHEPPQTKMLDTVVSLCESLGIILDASSAGALQASLARYMGDDILSEARAGVLTQLLSKPMKPATYFCSGFVLDPAKFHHYALNVPLYTHFTSPIRRYPDILVHRVLSASLGIGKLPKPSADLLQRCASHCNQKKLNAKRVHEMSCELFLAAFVKECGPIMEKAMIMAVMDHSFDVLIVRMGVVKRIYCDKLAISNVQFEKRKGVPHLILNWKNGQAGFQQILTLFSMVDIILSSNPRDPMKFQAIMKPPI